MSVGGATDAVTPVDAGFLVTHVYLAGAGAVEVVALALGARAHALLQYRRVRLLRQVVHRVVRVGRDLVLGDVQEVRQLQVVAASRVRLQNHQVLTPAHSHA